MNNNRDSTNKRFAVLAQMGEIIFHTKDLGMLWGIYNKNTLNTTLSRYTKSGMIYRIHNSLYSLKKINDLNPYALGLKAIHTYAYISCESILYENGIINQVPQNTTIVSSVSRRFSVLDYQFHSRQLAKKHLYNDIGINTKDNIRIASTERALCDMLYFNNKKYIDINKDSQLIDWQKLNEIKESLGYNINI